MALTNDDKTWIKDAIVEGVNDALELVVLPRFDAIQTQLDRHDKKFEIIDGRLTAIETRLDSVETRLDSVKSRLTSVETDIRDMKQSIHTMSWQIEAMMNDIKELYDAVYKKPNRALIDRQFSKLSDTDKVLVLNQEILKMAKKLNVELPR